MSDLIFRDALIAELRELAERTPPICQYDHPEEVEIFGKTITVYCKPFEQFQALMREAADALAVDAVEVVRCKDCKHYEIHKPKVLENCERNGGLIPMKPYDFCSRGERKGDDAN